MCVKVLVKPIPTLVLPEIHLSEDSRQLLDLWVYLLKPASTAAFLLALWALGSDAGWTSQFVYAEGIASHWQLWTLLGSVMLALGTSFEKNFAED